MGYTRIGDATSNPTAAAQPKAGDDVASEIAGGRSGRWRWAGLAVAVLIVWLAVAACTDADTETESDRTNGRPTPTRSDTEAQPDDLGTVVVLFDEQGQGYWCPGGYHPTCPVQCVSASEAQRLDGLTLDAVRGTALAAAALKLECLYIADAHIIGEELPADAFRVQEITAGGEHLVLDPS